MSPFLSLSSCPHFFSPISFRPHFFSPISFPLPISFPGICETQLNGRTLAANKITDIVYTIRGECAWPPEMANEPAYRTVVTE
jgi:hypothetical protein